MVAIKKVLLITATIIATAGLVNAVVGGERD